MKKTTLIILTILTGLTLQSFGQKLQENKTDEFTKTSVKRTSWESLSSTSSANAHFRISLVGDLETFDLKLMIDKVFAIDKDKEVMFKLDNGEILTVQNIEFEVTCNGCGAVGLQGSEAEGLQVSYLLSKDQIEKLKAHKIVKVRIDTNDGYIDADIKDKNADKFQKSLMLL